MYFEHFSFTLIRITMKVTKELQRSYDSQYANPDDGWRKMGAERKAGNILELAGDLKPSRVLEVGCGEGSILQRLDQLNFSLEFYGVDISESGIRQTQQKNIKSLVEAQTFDGYTLPYPDDHFDLAYCSHVIEHVEFPRLLIREIKRVSRFQLYEIPIDFSFYVDRKMEHFLSYGHINIYTPGLFRFLLRSEGHTVLKEICGLHDKGIVRHLYRAKPKKLAVSRVKALFLRSIPWLRGIKPDFYAVLTDKTGKAKVF